MEGLRRLWRRANEIRHDLGFLTLLERTSSYLYLRVWPYLPSSGQYRQLNGVKTSHRRRSPDPYLPEFVVSRTPAYPDDPDYEEQLLGSLRERVEPGDHVVVVGGGQGISAITAAEVVGPDGSVTVYEASKRMVKQLEANVDVNGHERVVDVRHAVVGSYGEQSEETYGSTGEASVVDPTDLPECDVLELDCEGAETEILSGLVVRPRTIIVETHEHLGATETEVREHLTRMDYEVRDRKTESEEQGIHILTACRS